MANALYAKGKEALLNGDVDWLADDIRVVLIDTADYTVNLLTHDALDDIPAGARVATSDPLTGKTSSLGVADSADPTLPAVAGDEAEALVVYVDTGVESTSTLLAWIDTAGNLPATPAGNDVVIEWSASGIFGI